MLEGERERERGGTEMESRHVPHVGADGSKAVVAEDELAGPVEGLRLPL